VALLAIWAAGVLSQSVPGHAAPAVDPVPVAAANAPAQHEVVVSVTGAPGTVFRVVGEVFGDTGPTNLPESGSDSARFQTTKAVERLHLVAYVSRRSATRPQVARSSTTIAWWRSPIRCRSTARTSGRAW
jgi:hypothetical protein